MIVIATIIAVLTGISVYNTPENRLVRQMDLGYKYLVEGRYEEAIVAFENAITIDNKCIEAYAGSMEAYMHTENDENIQKAYNKALAAIENQENEIGIENIEYVIEIYMLADKVYSNDLEQALQILEAGFWITKGNDTIKAQLIKDYLGVAEERVENEMYGESLFAFDRLLELEGDNQKILGELSEFLDKYLDILMQEGKYDEIKALADKYKDVSLKVEFEMILKEIEEIQRIEAENKTFMQEVYELMSLEDYNAMYDIYNSDKTRTFIERMEQNSYIYFPESNERMLGEGAGVYKYGEGEYYFYYGEYVEGIRKGKGVVFKNLSDYEGYRVFCGEWEQDAPNGYGEIKKSSHARNNAEVSLTMVEKGNLKNGLWDGYVEVQQYAMGTTFDLSFVAINGVPTEDKTEQFVSDTGLDPELLENEYIFAYGYGYTNNWRGWAWSFVTKDGTLGVPGFEN